MTVIGFCPSCRNGGAEATAAVAAGLDPLDADAVAAEVRSCYAMPEAFRLYDDTTEALRMFRGAGWRQAILSNVRDRQAPLVEAATLVLSSS